MPSEKNAEPSELNIDHFQCYQAKTAKGTPRFQRVQGVSLADQFGASTVDLFKLDRFCAPVDKNGEGIINPDSHLTCYRVRGVQPKFVKQDVDAADQFGVLNLTLKKSRRLCVPSTKMELE